MSKKKIIGIPGWKLGDGSFGVTVTYLDYISKFGKPRIIMPSDVDVMCDAVLMPGGPDVATSSFGQFPGFYTGNSCQHRQGFADMKLKMYVDAKVPIFGICLGMQMLNTHFGGSLTQHLMYHPQSKARYETAHEIQIFSNELYSKKSKAVKYEVNSHHHQAITRNDLASKDFQPLAYVYNDDDDSADNNYIVEAFVHRSLPIAGVQWHPEELRDDFAKKLFDYVLNK